MNKKYILLALAFIFASSSTGCSALSSSETSSAPPAQTESTISDNLEDFTVTTLSGESQTIKAKGEGVMVLNFWATWCPPCQAEMPEFNAFVKENPHIRFHAIELQDKSEKVSQFLTDNNLDMPISLDLQGKVAKQLKITAIPTTLIVDPNGVIRFRKTGAMSKDELLAAVKEVQS